MPKNCFCREEYAEYLREKDLSAATIRKYLGDVEAFFVFSKNRTLSKALVLEYKNKLLEDHKPTSVNSYLISLNGYFKWRGYDELRVKLIKIQKLFFIENEFSLNNYRSMLEICRASPYEYKWYLIMRCLGMLGIRVGELKFINVRAVSDGFAKICFKSKVRTIIIPEELVQLLAEYCTDKKISSGCIFTDKKGVKPIDTSVVWRNLKRIAKKAGVGKASVYPHNFRHLFARTYLEHFNNITELADILGHSSIDTTRLYTTLSKEQQQRKICSLGL